MKTWVIVRHAKSSWNDPNLADVDRPLNKRGNRDAPFMAALLHGKGYQPDMLLSSPAKRALSTAYYFAEEWGIDSEFVRIEEAIYEAYPEELVALAHQFDDQWNTVFTFGHNPTITDLINRYTSDHISNVPTCGVAIIRSKIDRWKDLSSRNSKLKEYFFPKQYFD